MKNKGPLPSDDPRAKSSLFDAATVRDYLNAYLAELADGLNTVAGPALDEIFRLMEKTLRTQKRVYVAGNGGSAAVAAHMCCDWMKGTSLDGKPTLQVQTLTENTALITALSNDMGYEHVFSKQLEWLGSEGDVLIVISSSGNSPNVVAAAKTAKLKKMKVISMTGFSGGMLRELADINLHVPIHNYGLAEDAHQVLMHVLSQFLFKRVTVTSQKSPVRETSL